MPVNFEPAKSSISFEPIQPEGTFTFGEKAVDILKGIGTGFSQLVKTPGVLMKAAGENLAPPPGTEEAKRPADMPGWSRKLDIFIDETAEKFAEKLTTAGDNIIAYYNKGIEGDILAPTEEAQRALQGEFLEAPIYRSLRATAESGPSYAAGVAATLLTKNPQVGMYILASTSGAQAYEELRKDNVDPQLSMLGATLVGSIEAATEKIPLDLLLKGAGKPLLKRFLVQGTAESFQELAATMGQNYVQAAIKDIDPKDRESVIPALQQEWETIMAGWEDSMAAGFLMGGGAAVVSGGGQSVATPEQVSTETTEEAVQDVKEEAPQEYDVLLEKAQQGDQKAVDALNDLIWKQNHPESALPTYDELLVQAQEGDQEAVNNIQQGFYQGGKAQDQAVQKQQDEEQQKTKDEVQRKFMLRKAHAIAKAMKMSTKERRALNKEVTGVESMKDMNLQQSEAVVNAISARAKAAGVVASLPSELADHVNDISKAPKTEGVIGLQKTGLAAWWDSFKRGIASYTHGIRRVERMLEALDGHEEGPLYNTIWRPMSAQSTNASVEKQVRTEKFIVFMENLFGDLKKLQKFLTTKRSVVVPKTEAGPEVRLSPTEKIGIYVYSQNPDSLNHLLKGNFKNYSNSEAVVADVVNSLTEQERAIGDYMIQEIGQNYTRANQAAILGLGRELTNNDNYFPMRIRDVEVEQSVDPLNELLQHQRTGRVIEPGEVKERKKGASQPLHLDAFTTYLQHIDRIEQFIHMAPVAASTGKILSDKKFRQAINDATNGVGMQILDKWAKDTTRGFSAEKNRFVSKSMLWLRQRGIEYALAANIPSTMRQFLSIPHAAAVDPTVGAKIAMNLVSSANPKYYNNIHSHAMSKSSMLRTRSFDRIQTHIRQQTKAQQAILRKKPWSAKALAWQRWADERTVVMVWDAAYKSALTKEVQARFNLDGSEESAVQFADKAIQRTQPMGQVEHLPDFFRGGALEKLLSTFQNQVNNNWNFWAHDIYGMRKHGKINNTQVAYRALMSYVIPALIFGMIGRGGLPKNWKDVAFDEVAYMLGPLFLVGRVIDSAIRGFAGAQTGVEDIAPAEVAKTVQALKSGNKQQAFLHGTKAIGAATGRIPAQAIRSAEGAYQIATDQSDDLRRLIWSEWSLKDSEEETTERQR